MSDLALHNGLRKKCEIDDNERTSEKWWGSTTTTMVKAGRDRCPMVSAAQPAFKWAVNRGPEE